MIFNYQTTAAAVATVAAITARGAHAAPVTTNNNNLQVIGYNTHLFQYTAPAITSEYKDQERKVELVQLLEAENADVVGLSEVWANSNKDFFQKTLQSKYPYSSWDNNTDFTTVGSGLLMLSKYPFVTQVFKSLQC